MTDYKILVCGDVDGNFKQLFTRVATVYRKRGPFECLLCVGNFFGPTNEEWALITSGKVRVPLTTYILGPNAEDHLRFFPEGSGELVPNLHYLGKRGVLVCNSGLRIAYISGTEECRIASACSFNAKDVSALIEIANGQPIDIMLTSPWPKGVIKHAREPDRGNVLYSASPGRNSTFVAYVAKMLKPRYHFAGYAGIFYERVPYRNHHLLQEPPVSHTRFIGLGPMKNTNNFKWIYAFNICPYFALSTKELCTIPSRITDCPFRVEEHFDQYFYDMSSSAESLKNVKREIRPLKKRPIPPEELPPLPPNPPIPQDQCWFCLTNPAVERHLVIATGEYSYVALAKGCLSDEHLIIVPMEHVRSAVNLNESPEKEIDSFKGALVAYFHDIGKDVLFFERNFSTSHLQLHVFPILKNKTRLVKAAIMDAAHSNSIQFAELSRLAVLKQIVLQKCYIFFESVANKKSDLRMLNIVCKRIPLTLGRMVAANRRIYNTPDKIDWNNCKLSRDDEKKLAEELKKRFEPYHSALSKFSFEM